MKLIDEFIEINLFQIRDVGNISIMGLDHQRANYRVEELDIALKNYHVEN